jgi:glyoxylase-like metal-dependent hydrolase (beta-lactamase superfamily II)
MADIQPPAPIVNTGSIESIAKDIYVIPDQGVPLVPNIGVIGGRDAVLVVDTGMGKRNAQNVLSAVEEIASGREIFVTTTHFHPEHAFGSSVFSGHATILMNKSQQADMVEKGPGYLDFFRTFGETVANELVDVTFVKPSVVYDSEYSLDLGGRIVTMHATGRAHTKGDQVIRVPDVGAVFCGDLVEESQFSIFPWFPPEDVDVSGARWINVMKGLLAAGDSLIIPGHGRVSGQGLLTEVLAYLEFLQAEVWSRHAARMGEEQIVEQVYRLARERHPNWVGEEWIEMGVRCMCSEAPEIHDHAGSEKE